MTKDEMIAELHYEKPESLSLDAEAHLCIPEHLHFQVLVCAAAAKTARKSTRPIISRKAQKGYINWLCFILMLRKKPFRPVRRSSYF